MAETRFVMLGNGTVWPNPEALDDLEWQLRYGHPFRSDLIVAASVVHAYQALLLRSVRDRNEVVRLMRQARKVTP
jgi:hypothetical protein